MNVSPSRIEGLAVETTASFSLIKIDEPIAPLQGLIVVEPGRRAYSGELKIQGITGNVIEVEESIEINVEIGGGENRIADLSKFGFVIFLVLTAIFVLIFMKRKRGKNENLETRAFVPADRGE